MAPWSIFSNSTPASALLKSIHLFNRNPFNAYYMSGPFSKPKRQRSLAARSSGLYRKKADKQISNLHSILEDGKCYGARGRQE